MTITRYTSSSAALVTSSSWRSRCAGRAHRFGSRVVLLFFFAWAAPADAEDIVDPLARALKAKGDEAMVAARYEDALEAYTRAANIEANPVFDYNRGRALQAINRYAAALDALERFERTAPPELFSKVPRFEELLNSLRSRVADLEVTCSVAGAVVRFDGEPLGAAPLARLHVNAGVGVLSVEAPGYERWESSVALAAGELRRVRVVLRPVQPVATLEVTSPVPGAQVVLDGKHRGRVPVRLQTIPGAHVVLVEREGYDSLERELVLRDGERRIVDAALSKRETWLGRWWFWAGVGLVAAAGTATTVALLSEREPRRGDIPPGTISTRLSLP